MGVEEDDARMSQKPIVGITEAARLLGVHPNTLRKWTDEGLIPHMKLPSGHRRFSVAELERFRRRLEGRGEGNEGPGTETADG